jgi:hypothetical protein
MPKISEGATALGMLAALSIWLLVVLPFLYGLPSGHNVSSPAQQETAEQPHASAGGKPDGSVSAPFAVQIMPSPKSAQERIQEAEEREEKRSADRWLVRWTAALFAATVGLILATGVLGYFGLQQSRDMKHSIAAAQEANKIAHNNAIADRRAWLDVSDVELRCPTSFIEEAFTYKVSYKIANLGRTLARNVHVDIETWYAENNTESFRDAQKRILNKARNVPVELGQTIFPDKSGNGSLHFSDTPEKFSKAIRVAGNSGRTFGVNMFITVSYRIDGDTSPHVTQYVFSSLNIRVPTIIPQTQIMQMQPMPFLSAVID